MMATEENFEVLEVGVFSPQTKAVEVLRPGEVGYFVANIKNPADVKIGDTITLVKNRAKTALPGFQANQPRRLCRHLPHRFFRL